MSEIKRPVFMSGENPGMTLYAPGTEAAVAVASYWHCTDSPWGIGHAIILWTSTVPGGIYSDNLDLARVLVQNLAQHFREFRTVPLSDLVYVSAKCGHTFDGTTYRATCSTPDTNLELEWAEVLDRKQVIWPSFPAGKAAYDLTTIICPCKTARISINGTPLVGDVYRAQSANGQPSSSAFLAFAESWIGPLQSPS